MAEPPGTRLGHYRLVAPIGSGGFATVYRAFDERLDAEVAIKVLAENHALDPDVRERFITEAQLLRRLADPSLITLYDLGETDRGQPYIVLAHADRGDLRSRVTTCREAGGQPTIDDLLVVAGVLAAALGRVHAAGLVHRDVTPDNLLISSAGVPEVSGARAPGLIAAGERLQLADLGLAKDLVASSGFTVGAGTRGYSAPEQRGTSRVDPRADVFGASAVLCWMVTGTTPSDDAGVRAKELAAAGLAPAVSAVLGRGLAPRPADRHPTIAEWHRALVAATTPVAAAEAAATPTGAAGSAKPRRWLPAAVLVLLGLLVLVVAIGGTWWVVERRDRPTVTTLADGRVRVERRTGGLTAAVSGPATATVGRQATFEATASGASSVHWLAPDGTVQRGTRLVISAVRAGAGRVVLVVGGADGQVTTVEFPFQVRP